MKLITCIENNIFVMRRGMSVEKMNKEKNNNFKEIRNVGVIIDIKFKGENENIHKSIARNLNCNHG